MPIIAGHVIVLSLPFANGAPCKYKRPFLVIDRNDNLLDLLNVSSLRGKEKKLLYPSNENIKKYYPPLDEPSFLKMDELYTIDCFDELKSAIYKRRPPIISEEFNRLINKFLNYKEKHSVMKVKYIETVVKQHNSL